jgi:hypothetical protein
MDVRCPTSVRMLLMPYLSEVYGSSRCPQLGAERTGSLSAARDSDPSRGRERPLGTPWARASRDGTSHCCQSRPTSSTSGDTQKFRGTAAERIRSRHVQLDREQPTSVYGLYAGLKRILSSPSLEKKTRIKPATVNSRRQRHAMRTCGIPMRSASVRFLSATTPSTW